MDHSEQKALEVDDVGGLMKQISNRLRTYADEVLKKYEITYSQAKVVVYLLEHGGQAARRELGEYLDVSRPTAIGIVSRLEKKGYVESFIEPEGYGRRMVRLSEWVRERAPDMKEQRMRFEEALLDGFSGEEIERLRGYLKRMYENVDRCNVLMHAVEE